MDSAQLLNRLKETELDANDQIAAAGSPKELEEIRIRFLGKKGKITEVLHTIGKLSSDERPKVGEYANRVKENITKSIQEKQAIIEQQIEKESLLKEKIDVTLPGRTPWIGHKHPLTLVTEEIVQIFNRMGYTVAQGPDVETDWYNFEALNTPKDHPARDLQATFYINENILLRTQTSSVQIRVMEKQPPPIRIIAPGRCYRRDTIDASHHVNFHQVEGLYVDRGVTFGDLKGTLISFARQILGKDARVRFRPHYFPFTEPSVEYDFSCVVCEGKGCRLCKWKGWLEISGAGMVDPAVFEVVGIDPEEYSGFAFGMGVERITMIKYGIDDIRLFWENDIRFLQQFG